MTMTYVEQAIQLSIEGGYGRGNEPYSTMQSEMFLDPLFWSCFGRSLGWHRDYNLTNRVKIFETYGPVWRAPWHRFIDHLAEGKDAESFFESLINVKG